MLSDKIQAAMNEQLNAETFSGYLYLSMAAYFESIGLRGSAHWMEMQAREEFFHASKFYNYLISRNGRVKLKALDAPPTVWTSPLAVFEDAYRHEQKITALINDLVNLSKAESDHASDIFLQWFVTEQIEEESSVDTVVQKLKLAGETGPGLFMVDNELATRTLSPLVAGVLTGAAPAA
ncbi:MAG: ferritin [Deltaproteobacteria bacterium]|nr:ferritin [Deltaproteobacteria bacterium]